jgi:translation initiation factor IF-3
LSHKLHELRIGVRIADHDLNIKLKQATKWLTNKEQVRFTVQLKGREKGRPQQAMEMFQKIIKGLENVGTPTGQPTADKLMITFNPKK